MKLPARSGDAGSEPSHPRRAISTPSHTLQRRLASGRAICCPSTMAISRRWHSETYPRTWASFLKQCHSPLALRQYSLSVTPSGVSSIELGYTQTITERMTQAGAGRPARHRECMILRGLRGDLQPHRLRSGCTTGDNEGGPASFCSLMVDKFVFIVVYPVAGACWHLGASIKDAGKQALMFSEITDPKIAACARPQRIHGTLQQPCGDGDFKLTRARVRLKCFRYEVLSIS